MEGAGRPRPGKPYHESGRRLLIYFKQLSAPEDFAANLQVIHIKICNTMIHLWILTSTLKSMGKDLQQIFFCSSSSRNRHAVDIKTADQFPHGKFPQHVDEIWILRQNPIQFRSGNPSHYASI